VLLNKTKSVANNLDSWVFVAGTTVLAPELTVAGGLGSELSAFIFS
jgi:hypothetical protein